MKEPGVFKTKLFGGFDKKDVFEYFEALKNEDSESEKLKESVDEKNGEIAALNTQIRALKNKVLELDEQIDKLSKEKCDAKRLSERIAGLEHELYETSNKLDEANGYKSRCDTLSHKIVKMQSELMKAKGELDKEKEKSERISAVLKSLPQTSDCVCKITELLAVLGETAESIETIGAVVNTVKKELDK